MNERTNICNQPIKVSDQVRVTNFWLRDENVARQSFAWLRIKIMNFNKAAKVHYQEETEKEKKQVNQWTPFKLQLLHVHS